MRPTWLYRGLAFNSFRPALFMVSPSRLDSCQATAQPAEHYFCGVDVAQDFTLLRRDYSRGAPWEKVAFPRLHLGSIGVIRVF